MVVLLGCSVSSTFFSAPSERPVEGVGKGGDPESDALHFIIVQTFQEKPALILTLHGPKVKLKTPVLLLLLLLLFWLVSN